MAWHGALHRCLARGAHVEVHDQHPILAWPQPHAAELFHELLVPAPALGQPSRGTCQKTAMWRSRAAYRRLSSLLTA